MKFKKLVSAAVMSCALASGAAFATPFTIDANSFGPNVGSLGTDGITGLIHQLGLNWSATSTFTDDDGNAGLTVGDSVLDVGEGRVNTYLGAGATSLGDAESNEGLNLFYNIDFAYSDLVGTVAFNDGFGGILANYTSGIISVFLNGDPLDEILRLSVTGSAGTVGNLLIFANVVDVADDIFFFNGVTDWADYPAVAINARIDSNLDPVVPLEIAPGVFQRTATLDGSATFDVPEPGILALLGFGFIGIGAARRMKKAA